MFSKTHLRYLNRFYEQTPMLQDENENELIPIPMRFGKTKKILVKNIEHLEKVIYA